MRILAIIIFLTSSLIMNGQSVYFDHSFVENDTLDHYTSDFINDIGTPLPYNQASWIKKVDENGCEVFNCGLPVGLNDNLEIAQIKISPNPTKDYLFVESNSLFLDVFEVKDLKGRVVKKGNFNGSINVSNLSQGVYILNFNGIKGSYKFVKM